MGIGKIRVEMNWAPQAKKFLGSVFHASFVQDKDGNQAFLVGGSPSFFGGGVSFFSGGSLIFANRVDFNPSVTPLAHL